MAPVETPDDAQPVALARAPRDGDLIEIRVTQLTDRGWGVGHLDATVGPQRVPRRYAVNVARAVPGDWVQVHALRTRRGIVTGEVARVLERAASRITPRCAHFDHIDREPDGHRGCGGCTLQSITYGAQLDVKARRVAKLLAQAGVEVATPRDPIAATDPWYYRNKMELTFARGGDGEVELGLHPAGYKHEVLSLTECHLLSPVASDLVPRVREWAAQSGLAPYVPAADEGFARTLTIREGKRTGERMVELTTTGAPSARCGRGERAAETVAQSFADWLQREAEPRDWPVTSIYWTQHDAQKGRPTRFIHHHMAGRPTLAEALHIPVDSGPDRILRFEIHPRSFFQTNTRQAEALYGEVLARSRIEGGHVLDLYCGTGTIGLCLAAFAETVTGVEVSVEALENACSNARLNGIENATFHDGDAGRLLQETDLFRPGSFDLVVVDPPRSGLQPPVVEAICRLAPPRLVYVSCNPVTLARDLAELARAGWTVESVRAVDMFPQTMHVECVAALGR